MEEESQHEINETETKVHEEEEEDKEKSAPRSPRSINYSARISRQSSKILTERAPKQDVRIYLEEKVFPILTDGLEELLKAVDERNKKMNKEPTKNGEEEEEEEGIPEIQPLLFLAKYLMRHAPQQTKPSSAKSTSRSSSKNSLSKSRASSKSSISKKSESSHSKKDDEEEEEKNDS